MNYPEFEQSWLGKRTDVDGVYAYQCVDLVKQYFIDVIGIPNGNYGDAIDYWRYTSPVILNKFYKVHSTDVLQGDVVVINPTATNENGHIGVATGATTATQVEILEQNGSKGDGSGTGYDAIRKRYIARNTISGLLRPKEIEEMELIKDTDNEYGRWNKLFAQVRGREGSRTEFRASAVGRTWLNAIEILSDDEEADRAQNAQNIGQMAIRDKWEQQIYNLQSQLNVRTKDTELLDALAARVKS